MSIFTTTMFDSIKQALNKQTKSGGVGDILRTPPGNTFEVRLLPSIKNPDKTFFHYYAHGWTSFATGQYVNALSPTTWGERDPVSEVRYQHYRSGTPEEKEKSRSIIRSEKWLVNAYVINDPVSPENNGTVKVVRFGKQLHKIVMDAIEGDDAEEFGARIFDLSKNGCNLKIKVDKQGDFPSYVSSRFSTPGAVKGLTKESAQEMYDNIHDLEEVLPRKTQDELVEMVNEHYLCVDSSAPVPEPTPDPVPVSSDDDDDDDVPWEFDDKAESKKSDEPVSEDKSDDVDDDTIKSLLDGLDDD